MAEKSDFDPDDMNSWYFGSVTRHETNKTLLNENSGVFLVRDSSTIVGDYVLCVKEDNRVSHYIINKITFDGIAKYRIGDREFIDLPSLLLFYKTHYLDTTSLIHIAPRNVFKVKAKFSFPGKDAEDLPFQKGDILTVIRKDEEQWWTAENDAGRGGAIPAPYVEKYIAPEHGPADPYIVPTRQPEENGRPNESTGKKQPKLPCFARVILQRIPSAYDKSALQLEVGDKIKVTEMNINGTWEGELKDRKGFFPFNYVKIIDENSEEEDDC